jgi:cysteine desulfurase/selenocysteine lyase
MTYPVDQIRKDFPILEVEPRPGVRLVYLDSTATAQKPLAVIKAMDEYYRSANGNIHRGVHYLAEKATAQYEEARSRIAQFIDAGKPARSFLPATPRNRSTSWRRPGAEPI